MTVIFISYSNKERHLIKGIAEDLRDMGHKIWLDQELAGGDEWWQEILGNIRMCDIFMFCLSHESLESHPCHLEYKYAYQLNKHILPVMVADANVDILPSELSKVQYVDYRKQDKQAAKALTKAINLLPAIKPLPAIMPDPPHAPISPLANLADQIIAPELTLENQAALLFQLKRYLNVPASATGARSLLKQLKGRSDLLYSVGEEINSILAEAKLPTASPKRRRATVPRKEPILIKSFTKAMQFELPPLTYDFAALEPYVDAQTLQIHHDKHHAAYIFNLNAALERYPDLRGRSIEVLLKNLMRLPEELQNAVRNNGGGHANHTMFWEIMSPQGGGEPIGAFAAAINSAFGGFNSFKEQFITAGMKRFGSGWVWLVKDSSALKIISTANQDTPLMDDLVPIMGIDLWEHAYYLKYQNRRVDYLTAWWNVVNWSEIGKRLIKWG